MRDKMFRVKIDERNESVSKKIRDAEKSKIPYMLVIGDKEKDGGNITIRQHGQKDQQEMSLDVFLEKVEKKIQNRELSMDL